MGEVYRARDTRLGRSVAIKVLHLHIARDPLLRERFEREARAVSSLNHPRICTLYDVGRHDDSEFLVMELVEGETLARRLEQGPLPLGQAVRCAIEIAEGLDHAHRQGITHRDLKPANIALSRTGAKLLDFGLAKLRDPLSEVTRTLDGSVARRNEHEPPSTVPTRHETLTEVGTILGTFEYMAPEQLEGRQTDERTDIFSFGAVLYETATGRRPFEASSRAGVIGAVLMSEPPPMQDLEPGIPLVLDQIVRRCLAKDPEERWQSVRDLLIALRWVADGVSLPGIPAAGAPTKPRFSRLGLSAIVLGALAIGLAAWARTSLMDAPAPPLEKWEIGVPAGEAIAAEFYPSLAMSRDGAAIVFRAESDDTSRLRIKRRDEFDSRPIEGSEGAHSPFFSWDGVWVGFLANSKIYRALSTGGPPLLVAEAHSLSPTSPGIAWGPDRTIVFAAGASGLMRVSVEGGDPAPLTTPDASRGEASHLEPQFLPGGRELLFTVRMEDGDWRVAVLSFDTGRWDLLPEIGDDVAGARYASGHLVYAQAGSLSIRPLDLARRAFTGPAVPLSVPVYTRAVADAIVAQFAMSDDGQLAYVSGNPPPWTLVAVQAGGVEKPISSDPHLYRYPRVSSDRRIAVAIEEKRSDIFLVDTVGRLSKLTEVGSNTQPIWMDGEHLLFASRRTGSKGWDIYSTRVGAGEGAQQLVSREGGQFPTSWWKDRLAFYELNNKTARDIWVWSRHDGQFENVAHSPASERSATYSPDGKLLAYVSNENPDERDEIYVQAYPGPGPREIVSSGGGTEPVWSHDGSKLFYRSGNRLFAVAIARTPRLSPGTPEKVLEGPYVRTPMTGVPNYDVYADGETFVMVKSAKSEMHLRVVQSWPQLRTSTTR
jgi:serine/threonine-protein kinase